MSELLEKMIKKASEKADEAELFFLSSEADLYKTVLDRIESFDCSFSSGFGLRVVKKGKAGFSFFTDAKGFEKSLKNALLSAKLSSVSFRFPEKKKIPSVKGLFSKELAVFSEGIADSMTGLTESKGKAHSNQNFISYHESVSRIVNSNGVDSEHKGNYLNATSSAQFKDCVSASYKQSRLPFDLKKVADKACFYAGKFQGGKKISGDYQIALHPNVASSLLSQVFLPAVNGEEIFRKQSAFSDKLNEKVMNEKISVYDNPLLENGLCSFSCDDEGVPARKKAVVDKGVLKSVFYDLKSASLAKAEPSGNGIRSSFAAAPRISNSNIEMKPDDCIKLDEVDGVLVYEVIGIHNISHTAGDFALELANACFLKNGEMGKPVAKCSIVGNFFEMIKSMSLADDFQNSGFYCGPSWVYDGKIV